LSSFACMSRIYFFTMMASVSALVGIFYPTLFAEMQVVGGAVPVDLKVYYCGKLILKTHVIRDLDDNEDLYAPEKDWELFLNCQRDKSRPFSATKLFAPDILKESPLGDAWKILQPELDSDVTQKIQIHIGGLTIVSVSNLHVQAKEGGWLLEADKVAEFGRRFVQVQKKSSGATSSIQR